MVGPDQYAFSSLYLGGKECYLPGGSTRASHVLGYNLVAEARDYEIHPLFSENPSILDSGRFHDVVFGSTGYGGE